MKPIRFRYLVGDQCHETTVVLVKVDDFNADDYPADQGWSFTPGGRHMVCCQLTTPQDVRPELAAWASQPRG